MSTLDIQDSNNSVLDEHNMNQQLMDIESSFLPSLSRNESTFSIATDATESRMTLPRATSLGSMASGISALGDDEGMSAIKVEDLGSSNEDDRPMTSHNGNINSNPPLTPKASIGNLAMPTDTVIANNVRDIEVPGTFARQYRQIHTNDSPSKHLPFSTPVLSKGTRNNMTFKEHSNTVDRLSKENFDLKMKIHFLDEALQRRSDESVKDMIKENVALKTDKFRADKENSGLRKKVRDLEAKLRDRVAPKAPKPKEPDEEKQLVDAQAEIIWLRERVESYEVELRKTRDDAMARESEKRRMAEMIKSLSETKARSNSDVGSREERDMWKDMLEAETAAREQADSQVKKLKKEIEALRADTSTSDRERDGNLSQDSSNTTLVELDRLKHENAELQKVISAQTSTLTSRNKEKERLYQEIEDLKLGQRRRSNPDSLLERSVSRPRSPSRFSIGRLSRRLSDSEREGFEIKNGELRDQVSELKLQNQSLKNQIDDLWAQQQVDLDAYNAELDALVRERDDAFGEADNALAELRSLETEAQNELDNIVQELEQKTEDCIRMESDLRGQEENFRALQADLRSAGEGILRLEEDAHDNLQRYQAVQQELEQSQKEVEALESNLAEANGKIQRLTVQQESSHNEIAFLREEQDADKIRIGDLEAALKTTSMALQSEKDKSQDLERRLTEERHQREILANQEKEEVQKLINELNREASGSREDARRLRKALSTREIELNSWKDTLTDFENSFRELFGEFEVPRSALLSAVSQLQKDFSSTSMELEHARSRIDEKDIMLSDRERLLEQTGHENRRLGDTLEKERQGRRADKHSFEQSLKSHQQATRSISQSNTRISDLEGVRQAERKKYLQAENQLKEQLAERNSVLLQLWKKMSTLCGPDWAHSNSLINGNLPSQEVIGNILFWPGFSRNLLLASKQVEGTVSVFKERIKKVERELSKDYQALEHTMELRLKKLERVEDAVGNLRQERPSTMQHTHTHSSPEINKLKGENRLLKAELSLLQQQQQQRPELARTNSGHGIPPRGSSTRGSGSSTAMMSATLMRHHSSNVVEHLASTDGANERVTIRSNSIASRNDGRDNALSIPAYNGNNTDSQSGSDKWIHRLRELERRLKAEREARLLDRSGARKRLEERDAVNEELRLELERERMRRETGMISQK